VSRRDEGLDRLVDLDGFIAEVGGGFWVSRSSPGVFRLTRTVRKASATR
jgi:hypothetical protein